MAAAHPAVPEPVILLVDDDRDTRELYTMYLREHALRVEPARDAVEARALLDTVRPDVLVTDLALPGTDGLSLSREVRAASQPSLRIVAVTGFSLELVEDRAREAGIDRLLMKPCMPDLLLETIQDLLRERST